MKLKKLLLLLTFFVLLGTTMFAQNTVYVDATNGSNTYTGVNETNNPAGTGPKATLTGATGAIAALANVANGGTLIVKAGNYAEALDFTTNLPANVTSYTITLKQLNANSDINFTGSVGATVINRTGLTVTINQFGTTEKINTSHNTITFTLGNISLSAAGAWVMANGTTITMAGASGFLNAAPTKTTNVSLSYTGTGTFTAGPESNYGSFGTGTITVNKASGTITFPNSITAIAGITVQTGASAIFSGDVAMGANDITNSSTGSVTFNGTVGLKYKDAAAAHTDLGQVINTAGGSISFNGATTWSSSAADITAARDFDAAAFPAIDNQAAGSILFNSSITLTPDPGTTGTENVTLKASNNSGTLSLGSMTANVASGTGNTAVVILNVVNSTAGGTLNLAGGTLRGTLTNNNAGAKANVNGALALRGVLTNAGTLTLNADLTMPVALTNLTNTGTINGSSKINCTNTAGTTSFNGGTLGNITVSGAGGTVNFITNAFTASTVTLADGTVGFNIGGTITNLSVTGSAVTVATTLVLTVTNFDQSGGTFTLAAGATTTLNVKGNFSRTSGNTTFVGGGAGNTLVSFTGSAAQTVNGGPLWQVENLTFTNAGGTISVGNSIRATGTVTISTATNVDFSTTNLILNNATTGNTVINNGTYTAQGGGGIIVGGATTVTNGSTGNGYQLQGTGTYSYVTVDVGSTLGADLVHAANTVASPTVVTVATTAGMATGDVVYFSGSPSIPAGYYAITLINGTDFSIPVNALANDVASVYTIKQINAAKVTTTLTGVKWNGVLTLRSGALSVATSGLDFGPTGTAASITRFPADASGIQVITGSTFNASNVSYDLTYTGVLTTDQPVGSELTASPANVRSWTVQTSPKTVFNNLPTAAGVSFGGLLTIAKGAAVQIPTGGAGETFDLTGTGLTHSIKGTFKTTDANDYMKISGASVTLNGGATTDEASIGNFQTSSATLCTISGINAFTGVFQALAGSNVSLGMNSTAATEIITGAATFAGTSLTLTTNIFAHAGVAHSAGSLNFGAKNLEVNTAGNFNGSGGTYTADGGYLVMNFATATFQVASALPNLKILAATTVAASSEVSNILQVGTDNATVAPVLTLGANNLTVSGNTILITGEGTTAAPITSAGTNVNSGNLIVTGPSAILTLDGQSADIEEMTVNSTGSLTIANLPATTVRTLSISDELLQTKGDIYTGINIIQLNGDATNALAYTQTAGNVYSSTVGANTGWLEMNFVAAGAFAPQGVAIDNLKISAAATNNNPTKQVTINKNLWLNVGAFDNGNPATAGNKSLSLADGVLIQRNTGTLTYVPAFGTNVDVQSNVGAITQGKEVPAATTTFLRNFKNVAGTFTMNADMVVRGTLTLTAGNITNGGKKLTLGSGATVVVAAGALSQVPTLTDTYNLTYTATQTTTNNEFITAKVDLLNINPGAGNTVTLNAAKEVKDLTVTSGSLANGAFNLTVTGNFNAAGGAYTGTGALVMGGTSAQTFTIPAAGLNLGGNLTINNAAGVSLSGGDLTMNAGTLVTFTKGVFTTNGKYIQFAHSATGQGFTRTDGFVNGNVRLLVPAGAGSPGTYANGRFEFPVGAFDANGVARYRPLAITFSQANPAINPTNVVVGNVNASPGGSLNLDAGSDLKIAGYPGYYWLVTGTPSSFTSTQLFDVELQGTNIGIPYTSDQSLRIVRRQDGAAEYNPWALQSGSTYANYSVITGTSPNFDTTAVVRTTASIGGIVTQGTRFTIGVPGRKPTFGATPTAITVLENATTANTVQIAAVANNAGETISTYVKVSGPAFANVSTTGLITLTPGYSDGSTTAYPVVVRVTTNTGAFADYQLNVTVTNVDRAPDYAATGGKVNATATAKTGVLLTLTYVAPDADGDAVTYTVTADKAVSALPTAPAGVLSWTPAFTDVALSPVTFTVTASSGTPALTAATTTVVTVTSSYAKGDANLSSSVTSADASEILKHVVGLITLSAEALSVSDVNADGQVGALDAAWILTYTSSIPNAWPTAKMSAAAGSVEFGKFASNNGTFSLPINLQNSRGVYSVYSEVVIGSDVEFKGVGSNLPEGWQVASNFENGVLKVAMAGLTPLTDGSIANINIALKNPEAIVSVNGNVKMNDEVGSAMQSVKVREIPADFSLSQNYPNPFNPTTNIKYAISADSRVSLVVYNILGQVVRTLVDNEQEAGFYTVRWDGTNDFGSKVSSGIYIYRINAGSYVSTIKMNLLK